MSIKSYPLLGLFVFILSFTTLTAQETPSVLIEDKVVVLGEMVDFDVQVTKFTDIIAASFSVEWDSTKLRYVGIENIALGLSTDDSFGLTSASGGKINYLYFDNSLTGNTLSDNTALFTIKLEVIAEENSMTNITFGEALEVVGLVNNVEQDLNADFNGAVVDITGAVDAVELLTKEFFSAVASPNPFDKDAVILLKSINNGDLSWTLSDMNGQLLAQGTKLLTGGEGSLILPNTLFKHIGSYILKLEMEGNTLTKQLVYIKS